MAQPDENKQKQIENCEKQIDHLEDVIADPGTPPEQKADAEKALEEQREKLARLQGAEPTPTT